MSDGERILLEGEGPVRRLWLNRPQALNRIDLPLLEELAATFVTLAEDEALRALVIAGKGQVFSAGFDVGWMAGLPPEMVAREVDGLASVYDAIASFQWPVIAAIDGPAVGGGLLLALVADFRLASPQARFGVPEVKIGIFPNLGLIPRLERLVGLGAAKELVLTGEIVNAQAAADMGLVNQIVREGSVLEAAQALGERLARLPAPALRAGKEAFAVAETSGERDYREWEREQFVRCWSSEERQAAMEAFLRRQ